MAQGQETLNFHKVIEEESKQLLERRRKRFGDQAADRFDDTKFGIALSGGGIRSATINLGFLRTLNKVSVLEKADYLSTVSGGGYTGAFIQATLKNTGNYKELFKKEHIDYFRKRGNYLIPGRGLEKMWNRLMLVVGFLVSLVMSWISPLIIGLVIYGIYLIIGDLLPINSSEFDKNKSFVFDFGIPIILTILVVHFISNILLNYNLNISSKFNKLESALVGFAILVFAGVFVSSFQLASIAPEKLLFYFGGAIFLLTLGYFTNPNSLSFHRFYREKLADTYLNFAGDFKNIKLKDIFKNTGNPALDYLAPYPLVNTCLNLQATNDKKFKGTKTNDYFLLSPLYCGSKLTNYVSTSKTRCYRDITLPAAVTISAAAINPGMGIYSNKFLSVITTLLNARLGYWIDNPLKIKSVKPVWWPTYFIKELFSRMGTDNKMLNISDGGHIENLGIYELLRRKCRLIIAVDAGADPEFTFSDLENLTIRARNELGLDIRFREDQIPEEVIRPKPSHGYSGRRFAVADIYKIWEEVRVENEQGEVVEVLVNYIERRGDIKAICTFREGKIDVAEKQYLTKKVEAELCQDSMKVGTLVYVKSSVKAPIRKPVISRDDELKYGTYKYKIYHPAFPHESTSDQFFDKIQWESYYQLGQYIGAEVLGIEDLDTFNEKGSYPDISINKLITHFDLAEVIIGNETEEMEEATQGEVRSIPMPSAPILIPEEELDAIQPESPIQFEEDFVGLERIERTLDSMAQRIDVEDIIVEESTDEGYVM